MTVVELKAQGTPIRTHVRVAFTVAKEPPQRKFFRLVGHF